MNVLVTMLRFIDDAVVPTSDDDLGLHYELVHVDHVSLIRVLVVVDLDV